MSKKTHSDQWVFTCNNPTEDDKDRVDGLVTGDNHVKYVYYQLEEGSKGTPHFQGFILLTRRQRRSYVSKLLPRARFQIMYGTIASNIDYCGKEETAVDGPWEFGIRPSEKRQGKRTDLEAAIGVLKEAKDMRQVVEQCPIVFLKYHRGLEKMLTFYQPSNRPPIVIHIYYGPPNTGKSYMAYRENPDAFSWTRPMNSGQYAMGYSGQKTVILDDFYSWLSYDLLLRICDRHPMTVNTLGGLHQALWTKVVITSNQDPREWYAKMRASGSDLGALWSRVFERGAEGKILRFLAGSPPECPAVVEMEHQEMLQAPSNLLSTLPTQVQWKRWTETPNQLGPRGM